MPPCCPGCRSTWSGTVSDMVIMGIDPGYAIVGYGVVEYQHGKFRHIGHGVIRTPAGVPLHRRLLDIYRDMHTLLDTFRPDQMAVEELFFNTNITTGIQVGHARGVILLTAAEYGLDPAEYTPPQIKQAVVGYGRAEKSQVMEMTRLLLHLDRVPRPDDAADALAVAVCHGHGSDSRLR